MKNQLVSIIVPIYNCQDFLAELLNSFEAQDYKNLEIMLVNDGSTDHSLQILNSYCKKHKNWHTITQKNAGQAKARNTGFKKSKGDLIYFCDSDDILHPNLISTLVKEIEKNNSDLVCCKFKKFTNITPKKYRRIKTAATKTITGSDEIASYLMSHWKYNFMTWTKIFKRSVFKGNPMFDERIFYSDDLPFFLETMKSCNKCTLINKRLYYYRIRKSSIVHSSFSKRKLSFFENINTVEKHLKTYNKTNHMISSLICDITTAEIKNMVKDKIDVKIVKNAFDMYCRNYQGCLHNHIVPWYKKFNLRIHNLSFRKKINRYINNN